MSEELVRVDPPCHMNDIELRITLARLDERLKSLVNDIARTETHAAWALKIASDELARRLEVLNGAHEEAKHVAAMTVTRDVHERDVKELVFRLSKLENEGATLRGKLWLPMLGIAGIAAGLAAITVKLIGG
jgi:hypothetical protein